MCVLLEGVQAQVDVGAVCILVAQPGLEFVAGDLLGRGDSLDCLPGHTISHNHSQPVLSFKVLLDVAPRYRLGLSPAFAAGSVGNADGVVGSGTRMSRARITNIR